jgi:nucleoid DNA-binding protein
VEVHLRSVTESSGLPPGEESYEMIKDNWLKKLALFRGQINSLHMEERDSFPADSPGALLLLTWSGSLISLGAEKEKGRTYEYASIKLRSDVPDIVKTQGAGISRNIRSGEPAEFENCPVKQSSNILIIAACKPETPLNEQDDMVREATIFLTNGFLKLNKTLSLPDNAAEEDLDHFTMRSMIAYTAKRNNLTQTQVREVIDDYLSTLETGMLLGERVPLGKLGRLFLKKRAAQKARMGRNPATGEEMLIKAKPETLVPAISFSSGIKEKSSAAEI